MGHSDLPESHWDSHDDEVTPGVQPPNSWHIAPPTTEPKFEPHCQACLPPPPAVSWELTHMDRRLLKALKIKAE